MKIAPPLLVVSTLLLSAFPALAELKPCEGKCVVTVTVPAGCGSGIAVAPDPIVVPKEKTAEIQWSIATKGWTFEDDGIVIHQSTETAFGKGPAGAKATFTVKNTNRKTATYKYDINLKGPGGRCSRDPTIVNQ